MSEESIESTKNLDSLKEPVTERNVSIKASEEAISFLNNIDEINIFQIVFSEQLRTITADNVDIGEYLVAVIEGQYEGKECLTLHISSNGTVNGVPCGMSIVAYLDKHLKTLEQRQHEYIKSSDNKVDRKTVIKITNQNVIVRRTIKKGRDVSKVNIKFKNEELEGFVSEACSILLHRLLIIKGIPDNFSVIGFDSELNMCKISYEQCPRFTEEFDDITIKASGILRTIHSRGPLSLSMKSYFTKHGYMTRRTQHNSSIILKLVSLPDQITRDSSVLKLAFSQVGVSWYQDMVITSILANQKRKLEGDNGQYVADHPEFISTFADFIQCLFQHKPSNVMAFAAEYFKSFKTCTPLPTIFVTTILPMPKKIAEITRILKDLRAKFDKGD